MPTNNTKIRSMKFLNLITVLFLFHNFEGSSSSSCGELDNIIFHHPFSETCSVEGRELQCDGNGTVLYFGTTKYLVKDVSIENQTFRLVDPDLAVGGCHLPTLGRRWPPILFCANSSLISVLFDSIWITFSADSSSIYFFNCTEEVEDSMYMQIDCMDGPGSRVYAAISSHEIAVGRSPKSCRYVGGSVANDEVVTRWNDTDGVDMMRMLRRGFVVSWSITGFRREGLLDWNKSNSNLVKYCWIYTTSALNFIMKEDGSTNGEKLFNLLFHFQPRFLYCTLHYSPMLFGFMVVLFALLDILLLLLGIRLTLLPLALFSFLLHKYKRVSLSINFVEKFLRKHEMLSVRRYDFIDIAIMTNNFKEKLGQGGFGSVYKGKLFSGCHVAVKILTNSSGDGDDFISEVATIGMIHHTNIVRLIGFCSEGSKRALVYLYMPNGSLDKYIFSSSYSSVSTEKRREIALGIARGIDYLHRGCQMQILHFDIKPHNILLDHDLTPKISDFGLAKLFSREHNLVTLSTIRGTQGYIAPEQVSRAFGVISNKVDVYSFGMLLMEMASGRKNVDNCAKNPSQVYYPSWIYDRLKLASEIHNYNLPSSIVAQFKEIEGILYKVALWCIQTRASNRPSMSRVIEMLQSDPNSLEMPPKPFTTSSPDQVSIRRSQIDSCSIELSAISEEISFD